MVEMTFEPDMLDTLAKMKGKTFKAFEARFPVPSVRVIPDRVRFNLGNFAVDLRCWYKDVEGGVEMFWDTPCVLSCAEVSLGEPFPSKAGDTRVMLVGERIVGIEIITFFIEEEGSLDAVIDMAVAIRTRHRVYTFSRDAWFSSIIKFAESDEIEVGFTEEECAELWAGEPDEGDPPEVKVTRKITVL